MIITNTICNVEDRRIRIGPDPTMLKGPDQPDPDPTNQIQIRPAPGSG